MTNECITNVCTLDIVNRRMRAEFVLQRRRAGLVYPDVDESRRGLGHQMKLLLIAE